MSRRSTIDPHPQRAEIEAGLARGTTLRELSRRYGVSREALSRHRAKLRKTKPQVLAALSAKDWKVTPEQLEALRVEMSENWLAKLRAQFDKSEAMQDRAIEAANYPAFAQITAQVRCFLLEIGKATGQIAEAARHVQINNFILSPSYLRLKYALVQAVRAHPEAREAIVAALKAVEAEPMDLPVGSRLPNRGQFKAIEPPRDQPGA